MTHELDESPVEVVPQESVVPGDPALAVKMLLLQAEYARLELVLQGYPPQDPGVLRDLSPMGRRDP